MLFPELEQNDMSRLFTETFRGYNHNLKIEDGEWYDEMNLTADSFPVFSQRGLRRTYMSPTNPKGMIAKDALMVVDGSHLYYNGYLIDGLTLDATTEKQIVSMGAYAVIFPDKKYINTANLTDYGSIEASFSTASGALITYQMCRLDGTTIDTSNAIISPTAPTDPENGDYWIDTNDPGQHVLKQYSSATETWVSIPTVYIRIGATNIGKNFEVYDGVNISGAHYSGDDESQGIAEQIEAINGTQIIYDKGDDYIVIAGILDAVYTQTGGTLSVERKCPDFDYVTESNNRIWGCKYGFSGGQTVNELYACKLGDFRNWECYMGLSTDSYAVSLGSDGKFTGAITHLGYPLFFKENCIHKIYGSQPSDFQLQTTICRGVQDGSAHSMCIVNETLIYKSRIDVCAYDGSLPVSISEPLGAETYTQAAAGATGAKYYISMHGWDGWHMFVYDISKGIWHHEDRTHAKQFATVRGELMYIDADTNKIMSVNGTEGEAERPFTWRADSGIMGYEYPDMKYISRFNIRARLSKNSQITMYIEYDSDGIWVESGSFYGTSLVRTVTLPVIPRRCDHLRLRLVGTGDIKIYSIARLLEVGSDVWD